MTVATMASPGYHEAFSLAVAAAAPVIVLAYGVSWERTAKALGSDVPPGSFGDLTVGLWLAVIIALIPYATGLISIFDFWEALQSLSQGRDWQPVSKTTIGMCVSLIGALISPIMPALISYLMRKPLPWAKADS